MPDALAEALADVAPEIDVDASRALFERRAQRRRRRSTAVRAGGAALAVVVAATGVTALDDDPAPDVAVVAGPGEEEAPSFEVLWVGRSGERLGTLRAVADDRDLQGLWRATGHDGEPPAVDLDEQVVVSITIADDACPPDLTGFERDGELLTPVFEEEGEQVCEEPLIPRAFVVAFDRSTLPPGATLRLPASDVGDHGEQRLRLGEEDRGRAVGPVFDVLGTAPAAIDALGGLAAATTQGEVDRLWREAGVEGEPPPVDADDRVVVRFTVDDGSCTRLTFVLEGDVLTPVVEQDIPPGVACTMPALRRTYVVALDRSSLPPAFTLRLPAAPDGSTDEQRLRVEVEE